MTRDEAPRLKYPKPSTIYGQFLPSLEGGLEGKMSSSNAASCILLSDSAKQVRKKIGRCFSGGQETLELHREIGGDCDVDVPFQMLRFFLEDDAKLAEVREVGPSHPHCCRQSLPANPYSFRSTRRAR